MIPYLRQNYERSGMNNGLFSEFKVDVEEPLIYRKKPEILVVNINNTEYKEK
jgi:hypothetical protein